MKKIPIIMPTYNRPQYLKQVLSGLYQCENIEQFEIYTSEEPNQPEVSSLFDQVDFIKVNRWINKEKLGCNINISSAIDRVFKQGYESLIVLEDDIVPGKDFLNFFLWGFNNKEIWSSVSVLAAYNKTNEVNNNLNIVKKRNWFTPWGWGTKDYVWNAFYKEHKEELQNSGVSWDSQFNNYILKNKICELYPVVGRSQNIGEVGTYVPSPEWQRIHQFCDYWIGNQENVNTINNFYFKKPMNHYELTSHIENSLFKANNNITKLPESVFNLEGMSGRATRIFLNELLSKFDNYLEIGTWKGSTAISAMYDNNLVRTILIDNFSEFNQDNPKSKLFENLEMFKNNVDSNVDVIDEDCFKTDLSKIENHSREIYLYDGAHDEESQYKAFTIYNNILTNYSVVMVDDWNWDYVRKGTFRAFKDLNYTIVKQWDIFTEENHTKGWHNGFFVAIIKKD